MIKVRWREGKERGDIKKSRDRREGERHSNILNYRKTYSGSQVQGLAVVSHECSALYKYMDCIVHAYHFILQ